MMMSSRVLVVFKSKYQRTVALSSAEAEYMALSQCTQEVLWTRAMLKDLGHEQVGATQVLVDNRGAIALASNAGYNARTIHMDIKHHIIRENVTRDIIDVNYVSTKDLLADMLTKGLGTKRLQYLLDASGIVANTNGEWECWHCAPSVHADRRVVGRDSFSDDPWGFDGGSTCLALM
ncbi:polyprotein [Phytophthora megakarya]|uniref:Polyprotein n=1 Tax=Phytophthora megakarya TaxID=4795 RepID=A0A225WTX3_9STRA|nr:polyprotein [Phytophthora megakarya]